MEELINTYMAIYRDSKCHKTKFGIISKCFYVLIVTNNQIPLINERAR